MKNKLTSATLLFSLFAISTAQAADGDNLAAIHIDRTGTSCADGAGGVGVGLGFDGSNLLASCYSDSTITENDPADGSLVAIHSISGALYLGALAWDQGRGLLWACSEFNTVGTVDLGTDTFTPEFTALGCFDGLAYDGVDDTLWTSRDAFAQVEHYTTAGALLSSTAVSLGGFGNSGIAVGGSNLYLANNGGSQIYSTPPDLSSVTLFATFPARLEDLECDDITFADQGVGAIWSIDAYDNDVNAWEIPAGACSFGGGGCDDTDEDGVCDEEDNCIDIENPEQEDSDADGNGDACDVCPDDALDDADGDGLCGDVDLCEGTSFPESVPTVKLGVNRWALVDDDGIFDTTSPKGEGPGRTYSIDETGGCSCEQIIEALDLGEGHSKFGCSISAMDEWVDSL